MHPNIRHYMSFELDHEYFECLALPFGWSLAPAVFTKFMKPVITLLRAPMLYCPRDWSLYHLAPTGVIASIYLDDLLALLRAS